MLGNQLYQGKNGFSPLDIISVERVTSWDGGQFLAPESEMVTLTGRDAMDSRKFQKFRPIMTPEVESQLKEPFGELIEGPRRILLWLLWKPSLR